MLRRCRVVQGRLPKRLLNATLASKAASHVQAQAQALPPSPHVTFLNVAAPPLVQAPEQAPVPFPKLKPATKLVESLPPPTGAAWIGLPETEPLWVRRDLYEMLWSRLSKLHLQSPEHLRGLEVVGHPGIGKSVGAINYCAGRILHDLPKDTTIIVITDGIHVLRDQQWTTWSGWPGWDDAVTGFLAASKPSSIIILHDLRGTNAQLKYSRVFVTRISRITNVPVTCALFASPNPGNFGHFEKDFSSSGCAIDWFAMPTWHRRELEMVYPKAEVDEKFPLVGGVPRHFRTFDEVTSLQAALLTKYSITDIFRQRTELSINDTSVLFRQVPDKNHRHMATVDFASERVASQYKQARGKEFVNDARRLLQQAENFDVDPLALGSLFENYVIALFEQQQRFCLKHLPTPGRAPLAPDGGRLTPTDLPGHFLLDLSDLVSITVHGNQLFTPFGSGKYVPSGRNFPVLDFAVVTDHTTNPQAMSEVWLFQVTTASSHAPKSRLWKQCQDKWKGKHSMRLVWVGPDRLGITEAQKQSNNSSLGVPQYSLQLPVHNEWLWFQKAGSGKAPFAVLGAMNHLSAAQATLITCPAFAKCTIDPASPQTSTPDAPFLFS